MEVTAIGPYVYFGIFGGEIGEEVVIEKVTDNIRNRDALYGICCMGFFFHF